ncbi:MAG: CFI-box-CTERM domain-containing protein [Pseudomonadota bacterium]
MANRRQEKDKFVSASQLAQMGVCERYAYFESVYGKRYSREQRDAQDRGNHAHEVFLQEAQLVNSKLNTDEDTKRWCFIASCAFTVDAPEVRTLRVFRDRFLRKSRIGRAFIINYYRYSPAVVRTMERHSIAKRLTRACLRPLVFIASLMISISG